MDTNRIPKQALQYQPKGRRNIGRSRKRWRDQLHPKDPGTGNTPNPSGTWWWWLCTSYRAVNKLLLGYKNINLNLCRDIIAVLLTFEKNRQHKCTLWEEHIILNDTHDGRGTAVAHWLRCCATYLKMAGSIPDGVIGIFHWHNPSDQPLTEMSKIR